MLTSERHQRIINLLEEKKSVHIEELVSLFGVSVATIRRDLDALEKDKKLKKIYGGATFLSAPPLASYDTRFQINHDLKEKIGIAVATMISDGESVMFDIGSTALEAAKQIKNKQNLMIVTNSISIMNELMDSDESISVFCLGGMVKRSENCLIGNMANDTIERFRLDKAVISAGGITTSGLMNYNQDTANIHSLCAKNAKTRILAADSSKFGKQNFLLSSTWDDVDIVVTDEGISEEYKDFIKGIGKELIIV